MGLFEKFLYTCGAIVGVSLIGKYISDISDAKEKREEAEKKEQCRINTPCNYVDGFTKDDFWRLVYSTAKSIKRIRHVTLDGAKILCTVSSQSGLTDWHFSLDYNDFGHITGECWAYIENSDSAIPKTFQSRINEGLRKWGIFV